MPHSTAQHRVYDGVSVDEAVNQPQGLYALCAHLLACQLQQVLVYVRRLQLIGGSIAIFLDSPAQHGLIGRYGSLPQLRPRGILPRFCDRSECDDRRGLLLLNPLV